MKQEERLKEILPDFKPGPLDIYRKRASFDWRKMSIAFEGEENIRIKRTIWRTLEKDPLFFRTSNKELSPSEYRKLTFQRLKRVLEYEFLTEKQIKADPMLLQLMFFNCIGLFDWSLALKRMLSIEFFLGTIRSSGTEKHMIAYKSDIENLQISGCIAITEMSHGTNTRGLQTTATYDPKTQTFILNTPSVDASKIWVGNLGQVATHAIVFAQLFTADNQCKGLHTFVVPIRDPKSLLPYPGIIVGDLGPKLGLNGLDNGFIIFKNYRIARDNLLNRGGDVTPDGKYISSFRDPNKRFGDAMGSLSLGRIGIVGVCTSNLVKCMPIAVRYSAIRKQFGPNGCEEQPVIEYQLQQWRIFPYLAAAYVFYNFSLSLPKDYVNYQAALLFAGKTPEVLANLAEVHAVCCAAKALSAWTARDAIQESREACGGHGYLEASGLGIIRNDNDANCTYEGDNNVLIQQTSNYLLGLFQQKNAGQEVLSPLETIGFINNFNSILNQRAPLIENIQDLNMKVVIDAYRWLVCYVLQESAAKYESDLSNQKDSFHAKNDSQVYLCNTLSIVYMEQILISRFDGYVEDFVMEPDLKAVLRKLGLLYGLFSLHKRLAILYEGGYFMGPQPSKCLKKAIVQLCTDIKDDAVALADAIAPPDFILNSVIGSSDGQAYQNIFNAIMQSQSPNERVSWWQEFLIKPKVKSIQSKL